MLNANTIQSGQFVRLTTPYCDAQRGVYQVIYVYSNGWLGVISNSNGQRYDVPSYLCRAVPIQQPLT